MCAHHTTHKFHWVLQPVVLYSLMILLGILCGVADGSWGQQLGLLMAEIFIKVFKCISLPIIALSLIVTLASYTAESRMQQVWRRTLMYTLGTTIIAAAVGCVLYLLISPRNVQMVQATAPVTMDTPAVSYKQHLLNLIPSNIFSPFLEHQVLGVLLVGIVIGLAIRSLPDEAVRRATMQFFQGAHGIFLTITLWIVRLIPLGLFGFITATIVQLREGADVSGLGQYLLVVVLANLVQGFIVLPLWLKSRGIPPFATMRKMLPALSMAFFSKSSAGTLPVTMATAEKNLGLPERISKFVLPLCTSINMNGCAAFIFITVIYLMQNHGMVIEWDTMVAWVFIATIAAVGNAGVPMGCFFLSTSLLASMNVPIALMGMILPFYSIIDMVETSLNVWSDVCVATVVHDDDIGDSRKVQS